MKVDSTFIDFALEDIEEAVAAYRAANVMEKMSTLVSVVALRLPRAAEPGSLASRSIRRDGMNRWA